jgi:hypothetical protein
MAVLSMSKREFSRLDVLLRVLRWPPDFGQEVKLGLLLRRTDLDDEQTEAVFGGVQGEGCS